MRIRLLLRMFVTYLAVGSCCDYSPFGDGSDGWA